MTKMEAATNQRFRLIEQDIAEIFELFAVVDNALSAMESRLSTLRTRLEALGG